VNAYCLVPPEPASVSQVHDLHGDELSALFRVLSSSVRLTVASYCGMSVTVLHEGVPVTLTSPDPLDDGLDDAVTSLAVPLEMITAATTGQIVIFASVAGAFVRLAADLADATGTDSSRFALDEHLGRRAQRRATGLAGFSICNQAIGVLVQGGATLEHARIQLRQAAGQDSRQLTVAAARIVDAGQHGPSDQAA